METTNYTRLDKRRQTLKDMTILIAYIKNYTISIENSLARWIIFNRRGDTRAGGVLMHYSNRAAAQLE